MLAINCSFQGQRVTGQQRYAIEIVERLRRCQYVRLMHAAGRTRTDSWLRAQSLGLRLRRDESLLTLTSRGPVYSPRHIVTVHDTFVLTNPEWFSKKYVATHAPILRAQIATAEAIVAVSETTAESVRRLIGDSRPIVIAPNAPADIFLHGNQLGDQIFEPGTGFASGKYVLSVASHDPRKNLSRLIDAYELLPSDFKKEHPLVLVGGGGDSFRLRPEDRAKISAYSLGYVDDAKLCWLYANAGLVVFPSLDEGFGLPVVEALAAGASVAVSDIPVMHWVAGGSADYFDPMDVHSMSDAISRAMGRGRVRPPAAEVHSRFSWDKSAQAILELVKSLH